MTVLVDAISKISSRLEVSNATELVLKYPKTKYNSGLEDLMRDIGLEIVGFPKTRDANLDFALAYGINPIIQPIIPTNIVNPITAPNNLNTTTSNGSQNTNTQSSIQASDSSTNNSLNPTIVPAAPVPASAPIPPKAVAVNDPKNVTNRLKKFNPRGNNRQKVVTLKQELLKLKIIDNPIAFCFIMRSMFEISAKAYCIDNNISIIKNGNKDKTLVEILRDVTGHLTVNNSDKAMVKVLHGAMSEIGNPDRLLSVTSMNQLVHNPSFSVIPNDICVLFSNVFPLLEAMN